MSGRVMTQAEQREAAIVTPMDCLIAFRTLRSVQSALGVDDFPINWKVPSACKDNAPLAVRRAWFYALLRDDQGEPYFSIRKLARIASLSEKVIRNDLARMHEIMSGNETYLQDFIENVCEHVETCVPLVTGSRRFLDEMEQCIAWQRKAAREARAKARAEKKQKKRDRSRTSEVDAIMERNQALRREQMRRIDMAIVNGDNANETEKRMARKRLAAA